MVEDGRLIYCIPSSAEVSQEIVDGWETKQIGAQDGTQRSDGSSKRGVAALQYQGEPKGDQTPEQARDAVAFVGGAINKKGKFKADGSDIVAVGMTPKLAATHAATISKLVFKRK